MPCAAGCGACCDPVVLAKTDHDWIRHLTESGADPGMNGAFISQHWHSPESYADADGIVWLRMRCDMFDPARRACTAYGDRPPVCERYPWYGREPNAADAMFLHRQCSYLAGLPPDQRPAGARPLIPITPVRG